MTRAICVRCCGSMQVAGMPCPVCQGEGEVEVGPDRLRRRRVPRYAEERCQDALLRVLVRAGLTNARQLAFEFASAWAWTLPARPVDAVAERAGVDRETAQRAVRAYTAALREHARGVELFDPYHNDSRGMRTRRIVERLHREADYIDTVVRMLDALEPAAFAEDHPRAAE